MPGGGVRGKPSLHGSVLIDHIRMADDKTCIIVTEIVPYLKRSREDEQQ
eukprot:COSAG06_NODE_7487_length_2488_cov_726.691503_3_plen_49_part_00